MATSSGQDILTFKEACERLKIGSTLGYELLQTGKLKGKKVGGVWRITESAIQKFLYQEEPPP